MGWRITTGWWRWIAGGVGLSGAPAGSEPVIIGAGPVSLSDKGWL